LKDAGLELSRMDLLDDLLLNHRVLQQFAGFLPHVFIGDTLKPRRALELCCFLVLAPAARSLRRSL
jgi:hypothetical protein